MRIPAFHAFTPRSTPPARQPARRVELDTFVPAAVEDTRLAWWGGGALAGAATGAATAALVGTSLPLTAGIGAAAGLAVGMVGRWYEIPDEVYHFTSRELADQIVARGKLEPHPGNHGVGVYATRFDLAEAAALQRAASTEVAFAIPTEGLDIRRTWIPGTFRIVGDVDVQGQQPTPYAPSMVVEFLDDIGWRDISNVGK
ncbi:MAG: hypothetical protein KC910_13180 [Candidatus Eremiobacteraeota bacterium]|nr:hypothetical protein [Candidatus Eremiobacteraeota bacterium]